MSDAFYVYTDSAGNLLGGTGAIGINLNTPWHWTGLYNWVLWINGYTAEYWIPGGLSALPAYNPSHEYIFQIDVGTTPVQLTFGVGDIGTSDNSGDYDVTVSTDPLIGATLLITPSTMSGGGSGNYVTADLTLPGTYDINTDQILWSTVKLEGAIGMLSVGASPTIVSPTQFTVEFDQFAVNAFLMAHGAVSSGYATLTVTFTLTSGTIFAADDFVYVAPAGITFDQRGVGSDYAGPVLTIDGTSYAASSLPASFLWYIGSTHNFAFESPLVVTANGEQYVWTATEGMSTLQSDNITVSTSGTVTGSYKSQYYLDVVSPYDTTGGVGWYDNGTTAYATLATGTVVIVPGLEQAVFTGWSGDATGTGLTSDPITLNGPKTAIADWKVQYYLAVTSAYDSPSPPSGWFDNGTSITASVTSPAESPTAHYPGTRFVGIGWDGTGSVPASGTTPSVTFAITAPSTINWNWNVTNICDLNHDGKVNMIDIGIAARAFGTTPGNPRWNSIADVFGPNGLPDGKVDMRDISFVAKNFGWTITNP
jgi:hypothetical protein